MFQLFKHARVQSLLILIVLFVALGTVLFMYLEAWTFDDAFFYSMSTVTTVGHAELIPEHPLSRVMAGIYMAFVIPLILVTVGVIADTMHDLRIEAEQNQKRKPKSTKSKKS